MADPTHTVAPQRAVIDAKAEAPGLWPHQVEAVELAAGELVETDRALIVAACGTGKTVIGAEVSRRIAQTGRVLIVMPTLELLHQTAASWIRHLGLEVGRYAAVCSDALNTTSADLAQLTADLDALHVGTTTDPQVVAAWLGRPGRISVMTTYASLPVLLTAQREHGAPPWDLVVIDEAHRAAGRIDRAWHIVHDQISALKRLYMTATPRIMGESTDVPATSMDDTAVFGRQVFELPMWRAIQDELLADYRVLVSVVTDDDVHRVMHSGEALFNLGGLAVPAPMLAAQIALLKAAKRYGLHRAITYHRRVALAERFADTLPAVAHFLGDDTVGQVQAASISGNTPRSRRQEILQQLHDGAGDGLAVVANARVLGEGVDVPALDAVMFTDPRESPIDVVQAIGRALRRSPGTGPKTATIIIPLLISQAEAAAAALEGSAYDTVWRTVRALRAHDSRLADWLDANRVRLTREERPHLPGRLHDQPPWLVLDGDPLPDGLAEAVTIKAVQIATSSWWDTYALAETFFHRNGHLRPSQSTDPLVFHFVSNNRYAYNKGRLEPARVTALEKIGMVWHVGKFVNWESAIASARRFRAEFGHLAIPQTWTDPVDGYRLGQRVNVMRSKPSKVPEPVRAIFDSLGMIWSVPERDFDELLQHAIIWSEKHGDLDVLEKVRCCGNYPLGEKLAAKRRLFAAGNLPEDQDTALTILGMVWGRLRDRRLDAGLRACDRWLDKRAAEGIRNPVLDVPVGYIDEDGYRTGDFIAYWRAMNAGTVTGKDGKVRMIPDDMREALDERGMIWRAAPIRRDVTQAELDGIEKLSYADQTCRFIELIDSGVTASSIADHLGVKRPTLHVRVKAARTNPETAGSRSLALGRTRGRLPKDPR